MAPRATHTGISATPTTPMVSGISIRVRPSSFLTLMRRTFPSRTSSLTRCTSPSPDTRCSSVLSLMAASLVVYPEASGARGHLPILPPRPAPPLTDGAAAHEGHRYSPRAHHSLRRQALPRDGSHPPHARQPPRIRAGAAPGPRGRQYLRPPLQRHRLRGDRAPRYPGASGTLL